ncbi:MAG: hypothetical protein ACJA1A_003588 [Saprospiraceae bacterium]|jgi:hypothetical protein
MELVGAYHFHEMASFSYAAMTYDDQNADNLYHSDDIYNDDLIVEGFELSMVCCFKGLSDCICKHPIDFYSGLLEIEESLPINPTDVAYASMPDSLLISACESCLKFGSDKCPPFKNWVSNIFSQVEIGKDSYLKEDFIEIYPCNLYNPNIDATDEEINKVYAHPKFNKNLQ